MQAYCKEIQQKLDADDLFLNGSPWLQQSCAMQVVRSKNIQQIELGREGIDTVTALHCVLRPNLFVWDPAKLGHNIEVLCPECGRHDQEATLDGTHQGFYMA